MIKNAAARKFYKTLLKAAKKQGWEIEHTKGGHLKWTHPDGGSVYTPSSPSDNGRGYQKARADLRKGGLDV